MFRSIRWRLVASYMLLTLLTIAVIGSVTYQIIQNYLRQREFDNLRANAEAIAQQTSPLMRHGNNHFELSQLAQTASYLGDVRVRILGPRMQAIYDSGSPGNSGDLVLVVPFLDAELLPGLVDEFPMMLFYQAGQPNIGNIRVPFIENLPPGASVTILQRRGEPWGGRYTFKQWIPADEIAGQVAPHVDNILRSHASVSVPIGNANDPEGYVELSAPPDYGSEVLDEVRQALFIAGVGAVLLAGMIGLWNSRRLASPINKLAKTAAHMGAGDLSVRADVKSHDEIGQLAFQFNQMAAQLQTSFTELQTERDALRRFIADASHELRTPITALKNFNALLLETAGEDPHTRTEFLGESQLQIERLEWIIQNLLDLSRLDAGILELNLAEQDLREVIQAVIVPFKSLAEEKQVNLVLNLPDTPVELTCDRARLEMAFLNLLDNALKFTPHGGEIEFGVTQEETRRTCWVRDNGAGIPPEDLPHIFNRFYRGREHSEEGSGLGLSIVKSIIEAHNGQVSVESTPGVGTTFRLDWPVQQRV